MSLCLSMHLRTLTLLKSATLWLAKTMIIGEELWKLRSMHSIGTGPGSLLTLAKPSSAGVQSLEANGFYVSSETVLEI